MAFTYRHVTIAVQIELPEWIDLNWLGYDRTYWYFVWKRLESVMKMKYGLVSLFLDSIFHSYRFTSRFYLIHAVQQWPLKQLNTKLIDTTYKRCIRSMGSTIPYRRNETIPIDNGELMAPLWRRKRINSTNSQKIAYSSKSLLMNFFHIYMQTIAHVFTFFEAHTLKSQYEKWVYKARFWKIRVWYFTYSLINR